MATTGFWPVKDSLKKVIDYADNPDKTTNPKYLDDDLAQVLSYAQNDRKTERRMFVSAINCDTDHAWEDMTATKKRFGKTGGNVAYHGYQSFRPGEVTPELAHQIGIATAREMWGEDYEIVVTTHLNTDSIHNHIVVNSVSFRTGKKFENHIRDHYKLREISDRICLEHSLSALKSAPFYESEKNAYRIRQAGKQTHRDILKQDIECCVKYALNWDGFLSQLQALGYHYDYPRHSVKADGWERSVRLDRMGYSIENIENRLKRNLFSEYGLSDWNAHLPYRPRQFPMLELERRMEWEVRHSHDTVTVLLDVMLLILMQLLQLTQAERNQLTKVRPLSPTIRAELARFDQIQAEYRLLTERDIHSAEELSSFIEQTSAEIQSLERQRQSYRNQLRHPKPPEIEAELKEKSAAITAQLKPLRNDLKTARRISDRYRHYYELLKSKRQMEEKALKKERSRGR